MGEEFDSALSVEVKISGDGFFVASEREHGKRNRDGNVDSDLTALNFTLEFVSCRSGSCENSATVSVFVSVDEVNSFLKSIDVKADQNRAEYFFLVAGHIGSDVVDNGGSNEVALRVLRMNVLGAIKDKFCTLGNCRFAKTKNSFLLVSVANGTQIDTFLFSCTDFEGLSFGNQILDPLFGFSDKDNS